MIQKHIKTLALSLLLSAGIAVGPAAFGASAWITGQKIHQTLADNLYGGCMVRIGQVIQAAGLNCADNWVSLDCDGIIHTQAQSNAMWSSALMALALDKTVQIYIDDEFKVTGGYCIARRFDVWK